MILRPSCFQCPSKSFQCGSDFTLDDFWGYEYIRPDYDDNMGGSLVIVNTVKGKTLFEKLKVDKSLTIEKHTKVIQT